MKYLNFILTVIAVLLILFVAKAYLITEHSFVSIKNPYSNVSAFLDRKVGEIYYVLYSKADDPDIVNRVKKLDLKTGYENLVGFDFDIDLSDIDFSKLPDQPKKEKK
jgi:hypothetical protein